jgi:hypothetical protein
MSTPAFIPDSTTAAAPPPASSSPSPPSGAATPAFIPDAEPAAAPSEPTDPGYNINDVGNRVFTPREGESDSSVMQRAIAYHKSLSPEQQKLAIDKEMATMPSKVPQVLGAAALAGVAGPGALAGAGEAGAAVADAVPSVLPHTIEGVKALGAWASKNPMQAYILFQVMKELIPGAKKMMGIVKGSPDAE